jgi:DNA-binding winged helix-turn-helix (wHTH) protein
VNQPMNPSDRAGFRIGDWRIEPALDEISRDGVTAKLEPRTMRVLVCLAEHAGEVVSVEQLLDAVWKGVVVTHDSVYQDVTGLRRALGDDPKNPIYIANVQRRGYRLIAPMAPADHLQIVAPPHREWEMPGAARFRRPVHLEQVAPELGCLPTTPIRGESARRITHPQN